MDCSFKCVLFVYFVCVVRKRVFLNLCLGDMGALNSLYLTKVKGRACVVRLFGLLRCCRTKSHNILTCFFSSYSPIDLRYFQESY